MPTPSVRGAVQTLQARARDLFLLESAEQTVRAMTAAQQDRVRRFYQAALRRQDVADGLAQSHTAVAALVLYREAAHLLVMAIASSRDPKGELGHLSAPAAWDVLEDLARTGKLPALPPSIQKTRELLSRTDPLAFDDNSAEELLARRAETEATLQWLRGLVEARTLRQVQVSRATRVGLVSAVVLGTLVWTAVGLFLPRNLALHRPVTISERQRQSTAPADNSGLVNGQIERTYGVHTASNSPWVMVDLQDVYPLAKVKVFNRADGWLDDGLPLTMELSENGSTFVAVDRRTDRFTSKHPWVFRAQGKRARFIRVRSDKYIALTELEVYAAR